MRVYHFSEQPYHPAWNGAFAASLRVNLPEPEVRPARSPPICSTATTTNGSSADELGLDIMLNEHHQTATCMSSSVVDRALGRWRATPSRRGSWCSAIRSGTAPDPLRVAEELSDHRCDLARPARHGLHQGRALRVRRVEPAIRSASMDRFWEAHDFILKAMTTPRRRRSTGRANISITATSTSGRARGSSRIRRSGAPPAARRKRACSASAAT